MPDVDPQQIMRQIEQELALRKTEKAGFDRNAFRIWALALIVGGMFAALWALQFLLDQMPRPKHPEAASIKAPGALPEK